jgi:tetratricopeptide (TPR) repeat protein
MKSDALQRTRFALSCLLAVSLSATPCAAADSAERLYSRGLVDFHAGRYAEALQLFEQAVVADPDDPYALYYRGVTHGRMGNFAAAIDDLSAALARKEDVGQATLELGVAYVKAGRFEEALPWLERAQRVPPTYGEASLFLGVALLRLGRVAEARANFERAGRDSELRVPARYYEGVTAYREGNWREAEEHFTFVAEASPESEVGREAAGFLAQMRGGERPRRRLYGSFGFQYDSNVALAPSDDVVKDAAGISDQADGRAVFTLGGTYTPWRTETMELSLGYEFYQSVHFDLTEFDLQDHRPGIQFLWKVAPVQLGFAARYDYFLLDYDGFLHSVHALPWLIIPEPGLGRTEIHYRLRWRGFEEEPFEDLRDAWNHSTGVRQFFYLDTPERYLAVHYRFDREDPLDSEGNQFAYDGHEVGAAVGWALPYDVRAEAGYAYRNENYPTTRNDNEHRAFTAVEKDLTEYLSVVLAYFGTFNASDDDRFDYDRNIGSVQLRVRF